MLSPPKCNLSVVPGPYSSLQTVKDLFNYYFHGLNDQNINYNLWNKMSEEKKLDLIKKFWSLHLSKHWPSCASNIRDFRRYGSDSNELNVAKFLKNFDSKHLNWSASNMPPYPHQPAIAKKKRKHSKSLKE